MVRDDPADSHDDGTRTESLTRIVDVLTTRPRIRTALADDIRRQLDEGTYANEERLNLAIYRLLREALA